MAVVAIPTWTPEGVLPPIDENDPTSNARSPYLVSVLEVVTRFSTSRARHEVMSGLLAFRAALRANGYVDGFQWLDGSFMEDVENLELRDPRDVDVVTFVEAPIAATPSAVDVQALDHAAAKLRYKVDSYFVELSLVPPKMLAKQSAYWYSVWAHRRTKQWKGFLEISLDAAEDAVAQAWLAANMPTGPAAIDPGQAAAGIPVTSTASHVPLAGSRP